MKNSYRFHKLTFLIAVLIFSIYPIAIAQQNAAEAQAEADAIQQIKDQAIVDAQLNTNPNSWKIFGAVGCCLGSIVGSVAGYRIGSSINDEWQGGSGFYLDGSPSDTQMAGCVIGVVALGVIFPSIFAYGQVPTPPADRLIGKSPEYIETYTKAYKKKARSIQAKNAMLGTLIITAIPTHIPSIQGR